MNELKDDLELEQERYELFADPFYNFNIIGASF